MLDSHTSHRRGRGAAAQETGRSPSRRESSEFGLAHDVDLAETARECYDSLRTYREDRRRMRETRAGRAWTTYVDPETGELRSEEDDIRAQGRTPFSINRTRPVLKHLRGQWRQNAAERAAYSVSDEAPEEETAMNEAMRAVRRASQVRMLEADQLEEHAMSGMSVFKTSEVYDRRRDRFEVTVDTVHASNIFFNLDVADRRLTGLRMIGELHDVTLEELIQQFASSKADAGRLTDLYSSIASGAISPPNGPRYHFDFVDAPHRRDQVDFYIPYDPTLARVVELWTYEQVWEQIAFDPETGARGTLHEWGATKMEIAEENAMRALEQRQPIELDDETPEMVWVYRYLTPYGHVLAEGRSPYWHGEHPYAVTLASFLDGEIVGVVADLVDPQRQLNRLYTQIDHIISVMPKGLWSIPLEAIPKGMTPESFAAQFTKVGNMLFYQMGDRPEMADAIKMVQGQSVPASIFKFLEMQSGIIEQVSGVNGAVMGGDVPSGTPASLYAQQVSQSDTSRVDLFETFFEGLHQLDRKVLSNVLQFYRERRRVRAGQANSFQTYDPERVRAIDMEVSFGRVADTALYRQLFEADIKELMMANRITLPQWLSESTHPRAAALLQMIEATNPLLQEAATPEEEMLRQQQAAELQMAAEAGDPDAAALVLQFQEAGSAGAPAVLA